MFPLRAAAFALVVATPGLGHAAPISPAGRPLAIVALVLGALAFIGTIVNLVHAEHPTRGRATLATVTLLASVAALSFVVVSFVLESEAPAHPWNWIIPGFTCVLWLLSSVVAMRARPTPTPNP